MNERRQKRENADTFSRKPQKLARYLRTYDVVAGASVINLAPGNCIKK